ncbi:MAG TPA: hypothetical protein PKL45_15200, partial [Bacteroidia bacterium]|nr:hypothetical protein [Bacteroidia bacterium]
VKQRIIMENIYTDESMVRPPYGCKPGLNRRLLTKWYKAHWEVHGNKIQQEQETKPAQDAYERYVEWAQREGLPVLPREEAMQLPTTERIDHYRQQMAKALTLSSE